MSNGRWARCGLQNSLDFAGLANLRHQISDHGQIDEQQYDSPGCISLDDFVDFEGNEGRGHDNREIFGPAFPQEQPRALGQQEG